MRPADLIRDPLFQLNLLLWMSKEQPPEGYVVKPLFFDAGFGILYIEKPFPFPQETVNAIQTAGFEISMAPEPELILGRPSDKIGLYFEAKANSFSSTSTSAKQAKGHLLAAGPAFAEVFAPFVSCLLCYVVPNETRDLMNVCLTELTGELQGKGLAAGPFSCHGLAVQGQDLGYTWDAAFQKGIGVTGTSLIVLSGITDDTDPTPLFLIYTDEDYPDAASRDLLRRCMVNQIHSLLVCDLNLLPPKEVYQRDAESLLMDMTDGVFQYLGRKRQKGMRRLVTENIFRRVAEFSKDRFPGVEIQGNALKISFEDDSAKTTFLDWFEDFKRTAFPVKKPPEEGILLFDGLDEP